jgi:MobA/MobL family
MRVLGTRLGLIQRSKGQSIQSNSVYRHTGLSFNGQTVTVSTPFHQILFHKVFLPRRADPTLEDPQRLWALAEAAENRKDAVLARRLNITLPRQLPKSALIQIVNRIGLRFSDLGVPVQVDFHSPSASDGLPNPHAHFIVAERRLDRNQFALVKSAEVISTFRTGFGRPLRRRIAAIINQVAFEHGHTDPLVTAAPVIINGLREPRLPRHVFGTVNSAERRRIESQRENRRDQEQVWPLAASRRSEVIGADASQNDTANSAPLIDRVPKSAHPWLTIAFMTETLVARLSMDDADWVFFEISL